ncbi:somatostatin receptor type 5-like isoform X1 [Anopheles albimanus]|uniref:somatostatin receptor type 5-like isoform X1 n=1 Tax=Anopheles albimanus TaxID=7167 RepID=UPI00163E3CFA|nr:somatostatin receptor type 5-like isoform X1 [Anopheles albimanus]
MHCTVSGGALQLNGNTSTRPRSQPYMDDIIPVPIDRMRQIAKFDLSEMDFTVYDYPREIWRILPAWEVTLKTLTFLPVIMFGLLGNAILCYIIAQMRALRTPTNLLIANLAVTDLATVLVCPLMFMFHDFYQNYVLGAVGCKLEGFLEGSLLITSVLCLCAISYDRLTAIVFPKRSRLSKRGAWVLIAASWICGLLIALPLSMYRAYRERQWKNYLETYCAENTTFLPSYWHVLIGVLVWFPLLVMFCCYSCIFLKLDRYERRVLRKEHPISVSYKRKVAKTLFIVLIVFVLLRIPFTTLVFIRYERYLNDNQNQIGSDFLILWYVSHYLMFLNAALNPLIYGLTNENFRKAFRKIPLSRLLCIPALARSGGKKGKQSPNGGKEGPIGGAMGRLQPRAPCGNEKLANLSGWLVCPVHEPADNQPTSPSRGTKISHLKLTTEDGVSGGLRSTTPEGKLAAATHSGMVGSEGYM